MKTNLNTRIDDINIEIDKLKATQAADRVEIQKIKEFIGYSESFAVKNKLRPTDPLPPEQLDRMDECKEWGRAVSSALQITSEIRSQIISRRTKEGIQARKAKGLPMGRPSGVSKLDKHAQDIDKFLSMTLNLTAISKLLDCNRQTLANWLNVNRTNENEP